MVTKRCRQRNLHGMRYTIKYRVKTRMATGVAVSTERVKAEAVSDSGKYPYFWEIFCNSKKQGKLGKNDNVVIRANKQTCLVFYSQSV